MGKRRRKKNKIVLAEQSPPIEEKGEEKQEKSAEKQEVPKPIAFDNKPWYIQYNCTTNPFSIKPNNKTELLGLDKVLSRLSYQTKIGNVICLEGLVGSGKTAILKYLRKQYTTNVLYYNAASHTNIHDAILEKRPMMRKLLMLGPSQMILFIDEADLFKQQDFDFLYEYYVMDKIKSIVFATASFDHIPFNEAFKSETKVYKLQSIKQNLAFQLLQSRLPNQKLISQNLAGKIYAASNANPRQYLANLEDLFKASYEEHIETLTFPLVQEILKLK